MIFQFKWFQEECSPFVLKFILFIGYWPVSLEKNNVLAYNAKTGAVTAQLLSAAKPIQTFKPPPMLVHHGLSPNWEETPWKCFLATGLNNYLFVHIYMRKRRRRSAAR